MDLRERKRKQGLTAAAPPSLLSPATKFCACLPMVLCAVACVYVYHILGVISVETDFVTRSSRISFEKLHLMRVSNETFTYIFPIKGRHRRLRMGQRMGKKSEAERATNSYKFRVRQRKNVLTFFRSHSKLHFIISNLMIIMMMRITSND